jgi:hypothetical protein
MSLALASLRSVCPGVGGIVGLLPGLFTGSTLL